MRFNKFELALILFAAASFLLNLAVLILMGSLLTVISFSALAIFYFARGFNMFSANRGSKSDVLTKNDIGFKAENIAGIVFCILLIGILYQIQNWPAVPYVKVGLIGIGVLLVLMGLKYSQTQTYDKPLLVRCIVFACLAILFLSLPQFTFINIKYRSQPAYRDALIRSIQNPKDTVLRGIVNKERKIMSLKYIAITTP